ncbi:hypothetical protein BH11MYX1_BH11MYX1_16510 [soil metagenome]
MRLRVAIVLLVASCGKKAAAPTPAPALAKPAPAAPPAAMPEQWTCEPLPFAASTPVPEASGAAWMTIDGTRRLVVVSDSGNHGAYGLIDPDTGATVEQGTLPLNRSTDDIEGLTIRGDRLIGITSPGWILEWRRGKGHFELADGPSPLGPVDLPPNAVHGGLGDRPPNGSGMVCDGTRTNCGRNYEGICLAPIDGPTNPLLPTGFAAAKADGHLYSLQSSNLDTGHELSIHPDRDDHDATGAVVSAYRAIKAAEPGQLADCAYDASGALYVANNLFGLSTVSRIDNWRDPAHATITPIGSLGAGFPEGLAVDGDVFYRFSDTGGSPSLMGKFRCARSAR